MCRPVFRSVKLTVHSCRLAFVDHPNDGCGLGSTIRKHIAECGPRSVNDLASYMSCAVEESVRDFNWAQGRRAGLERPVTAIVAICGPWQHVSLFGAANADSWWSQRSPIDSSSESCFQECGDESDFALTT